jgi:hypothetical protein
MVDLFAPSQGEDDSVSVLANCLGALQAFPNKGFTIEALKKTRRRTCSILGHSTASWWSTSGGRQPLRAIRRKWWRR